MGTLRPPFKFYDTFVVVNPIRRGAGVTIWPGTVIPPRTAKKLQLRVWFLKKKIAREGCDWANRRLAKWKARGGRVVHDVKFGEDSNIVGDLKLLQDGVELTPIQPSPLEVNITAPPDPEPNSPDPEPDEPGTSAIDPDAPATPAPDADAEATPFEMGAALGLRVEQKKSWFFLYDGDVLVTKIQGYHNFHAWIKDREQGDAQG
jgi:hypothetical protein